MRKIAPWIPFHKFCPDCADFPKACIFGREWEFVLDTCQEVSKKVGFPGLYRKLEFRFYQRWPKQYKPFAAVAFCEHNQVLIKQKCWDKLCWEARKYLLAHEICHHAAWLLECPTPKMTSDDHHTPLWKKLMRKAGFPNAGTRIPKYEL